MSFLIVLLIVLAVYYNFFENKRKKNKRSLYYYYRQRIKWSRLTSHQKGDLLENFVDNNLFPESHYVLVHKTHDYFQNSKRFVESSLKPDFGFRCKNTGREFYVEVKLRNTVKDGKVYWTNTEQLSRYNSINQRVPVFLLLGIGDPAHPSAVCLLPLHKANYVGLFPSYLDKFRIPVNSFVSPNYLWSL